MGRCVFPAFYHFIIPTLFLFPTSTWTSYFLHLCFIETAWIFQLCLLWMLFIHLERQMDTEREISYKFTHMVHCSRVCDGWAWAIMKLNQELQVSHMCGSNSIFGTPSLPHRNAFIGLQRQGWNQNSILGMLMYNMVTCCNHCAQMSALLPSAFLITVNVFCLFILSTWKAEQQKGKFIPYVGLFRKGSCSQFPVRTCSRARLLKRHFNFHHDYL